MTSPYALRPIERQVAYAVAIVTPAALAILRPVFYEPRGVTIPNLTLALCAACGVLLIISARFRGRPMTLAAAFALTLTGMMAGYAAIAFIMWVTFSMSKSLRLARETREEAKTETTTGAKTETKTDTIDLRRPPKASSRYTPPKKATVKRR